MRGIDLDIADKEFIVLVGPSGCGKSTTLRMIAGLEETSSGEIWIGGELVNDVPPKDRDIAMVFQNYALYPHMTVYENMSFGLKLGNSRRTRSAGASSMRPASSTSPTCSGAGRSQLSGGQRQRVAMGRAIVRNPKVFLFDEPLSNLDAKLRVQMRTEIKRVHQKVKTTTVYVTHDQVEAMTLADRVVVMNGGRIEQIGTPNELYHHPQTRFVAGFIGSPAMNFIPCQLAGDGSGLAAGSSDALTFPVPESRAARYRGRIGKDAAVRPAARAHHRAAQLRQRPRPRVHRRRSMWSSRWGWKRWCFSQINGTEVCGRVDPACEARPGEQLRLSADLGKMHLIDPQTEDVL